MQLNPNPHHVACTPQNIIRFLINQIKALETLLTIILLSFCYIIESGPHCGSGSKTTPFKRNGINKSFFPMTTLHTYYDFNLTAK